MKSITGFFKCRLLKFILENSRKTTGNRLSLVLYKFRKIKTKNCDHVKKKKNTQTFFKVISYNLHENLLNLCVQK